MRREAARLTARAIFAPARALLRRAPPELRERLEDRLFYAIFQLTRVTNDAYPGTTPPPGPAGVRETTTTGSSSS